MACHDDGHVLARPGAHVMPCFSVPEVAMLPAVFPARPSFACIAYNSSNGRSSSAMVCTSRTPATIGLKQCMSLRLSCWNLEALPHCFKASGFTAMSLPLISLIRLRLPSICCLLQCYGKSRSTSATPCLATRNSNIAQVAATTGGEATRLSTIQEQLNGRG